VSRSIVLASILLLVGGTPTQADELFIASYNLENLFDTVDDPDVEDDEEFTPTGAKGWTTERLTKKIENLSAVIKKMNADKGPDVLGVCEIENLDVVKKLAKAITTSGRKYSVVHMDSPSKRGIDCAIIYAAARLRLVSSAFHVIGDPAEAPMFVPLTTRFSVEAQFDVGGKRLTVFMNHWPSRGNPASERSAAAKVVRARLDQLLAADPLADVIVMGDLNDYPTDVSVKDDLKTTDNVTAATDGRFFNTMAAIAAMPNRGSYVHDNKWETIDHIIISPGLLNAAGFKWKTDSTTEVKFPEQIFTPKDPEQIPRPNRTYSGNAYHESGISDHLPVACILEF
jgi:predicted extracellular nuclease